MTDPVTRDNQARSLTQADTAVLHDRRRPGRQDADTSLIPLLRGQPHLAVGTATPAIPETALHDDLSPIIGVASGLGLASLAWIGMALLALR